jgi:flagellar biosynthetic protein FliR
VFVLVLSRLGAMLALAPIWGARATPMRIRALLAVAISLLVAPLHSAPMERTDFWPIVFAVAQESALGLAMGSVLTIFFSSLQIAGQILAQTSGLSLAETYDPTQDETVPVFSQLLDQLGLAVFILLGGHRQALQAVLDSFVHMPPGQAELAPDLLMAVLEVLSSSCSLGIRVAAPVMVAMLVSNLVLGLVSRALPQLNMMNIGLGLNSLLALLVLTAAISSLPWLLDHDPLSIWRRPDAIEAAAASPGPSSSPDSP